MYGYWPTGSGEHYIFGAGIWVGAIKNGDLLVSCGYSTIGAGADWMPGPPQHNYDHSIDLRSHCEDRVYLSTSAVDRKEWPLRDSLGFPIILSEQDGWCEYNDLWEPQHSWESGTYPLGLRMRQHSFCWRIPTSLEDMLFILYQMENVSTDTIKEMYVGIGADMDVGWRDDDLVGYDIDAGIGYTYCLQQQPGWGSLPPCYVGVAILQGPKASDTIFVRDYPWNPGYPYAIRNTVLPDSHLVLTSLARWSGWFGINDRGRYFTLAGYDLVFGEYDPWPEKDWIPDDKRMILGCGRFELEPAEVDTFLIAVMFSNSSTGGLHHLRRQAATARSVARTIARQPLVQLLSPRGGERVCEMHTIRWETLNAGTDRIDIYLSSDSGWTWRELATNLENTGSYLWNTHAFTDGSYLLKICGYDSLLFSWDMSDLEFYIANLRPQFLPLCIYPNPFSSETTIQYGLREPRKISLKVYDLLGQEVRVLVDEHQGAGIHTRSWDGRDDAGRRVSAGPYFLRLIIESIGELGDYAATRKACVMR